MLPCLLVCTVLCVHVKRSHHPLPPFPPYLHLQFSSLQRQRILRGCVPTIAHRLTIPPACVFRLVPERTKSRWIHRIVVRVMSVFVARAYVRQQCVHYAVVPLRAYVFQAPT